MMTTAESPSLPRVKPSIPQAPVVNAEAFPHEQGGRERDRRHVSVDEYRAFRRDGFLAVRGLVSPQEIAELRDHTEQLMRGELPEQQDAPVNDGSAAGTDGRGEGGTVRHLSRPPAGLTPAQKAQFFLRIHMLHREVALHERYLLHPRVLDVLEVLIGPDVSALQSMLFLKPPGKIGQGWHQDSYYIPTSPDTLCGAWVAIDDADERNGAMWFAKGSGHEPIYPPCPQAGYGFGDRHVSGIRHIKGASNPDDAQNLLSDVAAGYDQILCEVRAGDVVFFNGHVLHRSKDNWTSDRFRRAFVGHYCNARSVTQWAVDQDNPAGRDEATGMTNGSHILCRGDTHLPFARPKFGTPCAALLSKEQRAGEAARVTRILADHGDGLMGCGIVDPAEKDDHDDAPAMTMMA